MNFFLILLSLFFISSLTVFIVRALLLRLAIFDVPNERSSHTVPTPRGGGIAIALSFYIGLMWLYHINLVPENVALALLGGILIALVGWLDDLYSLSARWRALFHFISAIWALYCLNGFPSVNVGVSTLYLGWIGSMLGVFGIVWSINFYNFMDGIDGLAGSEAVFVSLVAGILLFLIGSKLAFICLLLVPATLGFLIWNWPKAKIFMGDIGSGLLGYLFAVLAIASENQHALPMICWIILLAVFIFDTTFTLISRLKRRQALHMAHREHVYQKLVQKGFSHQKVTLFILFFNVSVLLPLTLIALKWPILLLPCLLAATLILLLASVAIKAMK